MSPISVNPNVVSRADLTSRYGAEAPGRWAGQTAAGRGADSVDVSAEARQASDAQQGTRTDLVQRVRDQIAAGTYETDLKVVVATEGLRRAAYAQQA
jgi:anti-sigma28 factor (negative regulator of flagellin synthesis)